MSPYLHTYTNEASASFAAFIASVELSALTGHAIHVSYVEINPGRFWLVVPDLTGVIVDDETTIYRAEHVIDVALKEIALTKALLESLVDDVMDHDLDNDGNYDGNMSSDPAGWAHEVSAILRDQSNDVMESLLAEEPLVCTDYGICEYSLTGLES